LADGEEDGDGDGEGEASGEAAACPPPRSASVNDGAGFAGGFLARRSCSWRAISPSDWGAPALASRDSTTPASGMKRGPGTGLA